MDQTPHDPHSDPIADDAPDEQSFRQRGTFTGAYGEDAAAAWNDEHDALTTDKPTEPRPSGMGGTDTGYDTESGFTPPTPDNRQD